MNKSFEISSQSKEILNARSEKFKNYFKSCSTSSLNPKTTHLVSVAINLVNNNKKATSDSLKLAIKAGTTSEELHRVACLCACVSGIRVEDLYFDILRSIKTANRESAKLYKDITVPEDFAFASQGTTSVFESHKLCSNKSLDKKTERLVSLGACLAANCKCTADHLIEARLAKISHVEVTRVACIAACCSGFRILDEYEDHLRRAAQN